MGQLIPALYCGRVKLRYLCLQKIAGERKEIRKMIGKYMGGKKEVKGGETEGGKSRK